MYYQQKYLINIIILKKQIQKEDPYDVIIYLEYKKNITLCLDLENNYNNKILPNDIYCRYKFEMVQDQNKLFNKYITVDLSKITRNYYNKLIIALWNQETEQQYGLQVTQDEYNSLFIQYWIQSLFFGMIGVIAIYIVIFIFRYFCLSYFYRNNGSNRVIEQDREKDKKIFLEKIDKKFPLEKYKILRLENDIESTCVICLEDFTDETDCRLIMCKHIFHEDCINSWIVKYKNCPVCRADIKLELDEL